MAKAGWALAIILSFVAASVAANAPKPNADRGRNVFRQSCKKCHSKGASGGEITPLNKTSAQWRTYFEKGKHANGTLVQVMSDEQQLRDTQAFLVSHAADSEQPEVCGK